MPKYPDTKLEEKYQTSKGLEELAAQILAANQTELRDATLFKVGYIYTRKKIHHIAGFCMKVSEAVRFKTGLDFLIVIAFEHFQKVPPEIKAQVMIHELYHIKDVGGKEPRPGIRNHGGDYCEIPEHDKFSVGVYEKIRDQLPILSKLPFQTTLESMGKAPDQPTLEDTSQGGAPPAQ